jgi:hypothetical protein
MVYRSQRQPRAKMIVVHLQTGSIPGSYSGRVAFRREKCHETGACVRDLINVRWTVLVSVAMPVVDSLVAKCQLNVSRQVEEMAVQCGLGVKRNACLFEVLMCVTKLTPWR